MGRYYSGDIEGKFWFGVQASNDADFFGVVGYQPSELHYNFWREDLPKIKEGIKRCEKELGKESKKLEVFFKDKPFYNESELAEELKIDIVKVPSLLEWYARLLLGIKIKECVEKNGSCDFVAEQ